MNDRDYEREVLDKKIPKILEKYKNKPRIYQKMKDFSKLFMNQRYINPSTYRDLAKLTSKINYRCEFENGKCRAGRSTEMCCCSNCNDSLGHIHERFFNYSDSEQFIEEELLYYVRKFSTQTGFWRKGKGCTLPRERRSSTCLIYNCTSKLTMEENLLLDIIRDHKPLPNYVNRIIEILKDYFLYRE